jgi:hypothetical protein
MHQQAPSMLKPALISGIAFGVAGAIPVINWINCACCALIIGCGFLAAYLQSKQCKAAGVEFRGGNGALVGLAAGVVYGIVSGILGTLLNMLFGIGDWTEVIEQMDQTGAMDPEVMDQVTRLMESTGPALMLIAAVFFSVLFGAIFATIGGLIGGSVFKNEPTQPMDGVTMPPPQAAPPVEQPPPPPVQPGI